MSWKSWAGANSRIFQPIRDTWTISGNESNHHGQRGFAKRDSHHEWATRVIDDLPVGALVCEAVLAEVCHLVGKDGVPATAVLKLVEQNDLVLVSLVGEISAVRALMERYKDAPMDFADASVVRMVDLNSNAVVCTTDGHFRFFRKTSGEIITLLAPFAG